MSLSTVQHYMLASSIPLLQGQQLCKLLSKMDEEEQKTLIEEKNRFDKELQDLAEHNSYKDIFLKSIYAGLGISSGISTVTYGADVKLNKPDPFRPEIYWKAEDAEKDRILYDKREVQRLESAGKDAVKAAAISFLVAGFVYGFYRFASYREEKRELTENLCSQINTHRILRLKDKVVKIEERQAQNIEQEKEQLDRSKKYFDQMQLEMTLSKTNKITVVHYHV